MMLVSGLPSLYFFEGCLDAAKKNADSSCKGAPWECGMLCYDGDA